MVAEDIVMIIFNKAREKKSDFKDSSHLAKFLYTSVHNRAIDKKTESVFLKKKLILVLISKIY